MSEYYVNHERIRELTEEVKARVAVNQATLYGIRFAIFLEGKRRVALAIQKQIHTHERWLVFHATLWAISLVVFVGVMVEGDWLWAILMASVGLGNLRELLRELAKVRSLEKQLEALNYD